MRYERCEPNYRSIYEHARQQLALELQLSHEQEPREDTITTLLTLMNRLTLSVVSTEMLENLRETMRQCMMYTRNEIAELVLPPLPPE